MFSINFSIHACLYIYTVFIGFPYNLMHHFCSDLKLPFQLRSFVWLNLLLARRSFTVCLQWQWNCSAMWDYALVSSCKIDDSMPPRSSQHLQKPIKMDFLTSPIWTAWVWSWIDDWFSGWFFTQHCPSIIVAIFRTDILLIRLSVMLMIVSVSISTTNQQIWTHLSNIYDYICLWSQKMSHVFVTIFFTFFSAFHLLNLRTDTIWLIFKEPLTISRAQRDLYRGVGGSPRIPVVYPRWWFVNKSYLPLATKI